MYKDGDVFFKYDFFGMVKENWKINNKEAVEDLKNNLIRIKSEFEGVND